MEFAFLLFAFLIGSVLGSFLCELSDRWSQGKQALLGRSECEHCHHKLGVLDLIPVVSYITLSGKCRYCHTKIPFHVFMVELSAGLLTLLFVWWALQVFMPPLEALLLYIIFFSFAGIFVSDFLYGIIPDQFNIAASLATFFTLAIYFREDLPVHIIVGIATCLFFVALFLITRGRGMGLGDVKFAFVLGFFAGFPAVLVSLYFAFLTACAVSLILIVTGKKKLKGGTISFGPFLVAGAVFAFFATNRIVDFFI